MNEEMKDALSKYLDAIRTDYARWVRSDGTTEYREVMIEEFNDLINYTVEEKYLRVNTTSAGQEMVHSFVVLNDEPKFKKGDILKAESWRSPETNFARGNIFKDVSHIQWFLP